MRTNATNSENSLSWPSLIIAISLMLLGTALPIWFKAADGHADHTLAALVFWSMSAGFVRGVGFVPQHWLPRTLLSSMACYLTLAVAMLWVLWR